MGRTVTLTATPAEGSHFVKWEVVSGNIVLNGNTFTMPARDVTVKAVFAEHTYSGWTQNDNDTHTRACTVCGAEQTEACIGGEATCTKEAVCQVCGQPYGDLDPDNHINLTEVEAVAATQQAEGNTAYWYCEDCGRYFADADALEEISPEDTVIDKLPADTSENGSDGRPENGDNTTAGGTGTAGS